MGKIDYTKTIYSYPKDGKIVVTNDISSISKEDAEKFKQNGYNIKFNGES